MRLTTAWIAAVVLSGSALAQQRVTTPTSPTGFGRILFPGGTSPNGPGRNGTVSPYGRVLFPGGTAPAGVASPQNSGRHVFPGGGAPATLRSGNLGPGLIGNRSPVVHGSHSASILIPIPVYTNGYYGYDAPVAQYAPTATYPGPNNVSSNALYGTSNDDSNASPVVIVNQYFRPDGAFDSQRDTQPYGPGDYQPQEFQSFAPPAQEMPAQSAPARPESTVFLIAMMDHTIYSANAYWIENGVLNYVTLGGDVNSASMELVDRDLSRRLNKDRNVGFGLPEK